MNILMFNMSNYTDWQKGISNRNYQILHTLEKNPNIDKIIAVDFLPFTLKRTVRNYYECVIKGPEGKEIIYGDISSKFRQVSSKIYNFTTVDSFFSEKKVIKELKKILDLVNIKDDLVIWSYNPMFAEMIKEFNKNLFVFDTVDNWAYHADYVKKYGKRLNHNYKYIAESADIIFTVAKELVDFYKTIGREKQIYWVPNGVALEMYQDSEAINQKNEISDTNYPVIGYLGTIQERMDVDLLKYLVEKNPNFNFVMAGPVWRKTQSEINAKIGNKHNLKFLGRVAFRLSPSIINKFDVCIIPHKIDEFLKTTDPLKMYEYLALGKPIVTTEGAGVDVFDKFLYIAKDYNEFDQKIKKALSENDNRFVQDRKDIIKNHTWEKRVYFMMEKINNLL